MKLIRARLGDVVDLRCSIPSLIHRIGKCVDRHFRNRIQSQDEIGGEAAIEIGERIVRFQPIHDVAIGKRGESVEFHVAIAVAAANKIVAASCRIDQRPRRKLQRVGQVPSRIRQVLQRRRIQGCGCVGVFRIDERGFAAHLNRLIGPRHLEREIHSLFLAQPRNDVVILPRIEARCFRSNRIGARL